jgi:hypothetical protein
MTTFGHSYSGEQLCSENPATTNRMVLRYGTPKPPGFHGKKRLMSGNEIMMNSKKRKSSCFLCGLKGYQARGNRCPFVQKYQAVLVESADVPEMATGIGNPMLYDIKKTVANGLERGRLCQSYKGRRRRRIMKTCNSTRCDVMLINIAVVANVG